MSCPHKNLETEHLKEQPNAEFRKWGRFGPFEVLSGDSKASLIAQLVNNPPVVQETPVLFLGREDPWRRDSLPAPVFLGFPCGSAGNESACNAGDLGSVPGLGRSPGEGKGYALQCSGLEKSMDCTACGVAKCRTRTRLSDLHFQVTVWLEGGA